ncbi:hypothetical protein [Alcanivorax hongdengensis]|uniref:hypothetical protein n=1 Tax=Alcanivorax hongdengensis TaxID=519051 RepID=UPI0012FCAA09|nr:hypothetical protein [Alcanivorax hongdengensis]
MPAMRGLLFGGRIPTFTSSMQRTSLRVLKEANKFDMPWAKRGLFEDSLREALVSVAKSSGEVSGGNGRKRADAVFSSASSDQQASAIVKAVKDIAVDSRLEVENRRLKLELERLRQQANTSKKS